MWEGYRRFGSREEFKNEKGKMKNGKGKGKRGK
jgi:hypothetical protein